jgi:hypothetical protein
MEHRLMTEQEKVEIYMKSVELRKAGKIEEAFAVRKQILLPAFLAKFAKEHMGVDFLLELEWNLAEVEEQFGKCWLNT